MGLGGLIGLPATARILAAKKEEEGKFRPYTPGSTGNLASVGDMVSGPFPDPVNAPPAAEPQGGTLYQLTHGGWDIPVERPTGISQTKPAAEQSFAPYEQAHLDDVKTGLWGMALGGMAPGLGLPGIMGKPPKAPISGKSKARRRIEGDGGGEALQA